MDDLKNGELDLSAQGPTTYYFPHLAVGAGWQTTLTYINYSPQEVTCRTDFFSGQGTPLTVSFPGRGPGCQPQRHAAARRLRSRGNRCGVERSACIRLGAGRLHGAGEGQPAVSAVRQRRRAHGRSGSQCGGRSGHPLRDLCRKARRAAGDRGCLCQPLRHVDGRGHLYGQGRGWADTGQRRPDADTQRHGAQNIAGLFSLASFTGSLEITSSEPIVTLSLNAEAAPVFSSLPPGEVQESAP